MRSISRRRTQDSDRHLISKSSSVPEEGIQVSESEVSVEKLASEEESTDSRRRNLNQNSRYLLPCLNMIHILLH